MQLRSLLYKLIPKLNNYTTPRQSWNIAKVAVKHHKTNQAKLN
jgi:hypothetical protein